MKELFISDLDGTLLNKNVELSEFTKNSLNKLIKSGMNFSIATARSPSSVKKIISGLNIKMPIVMMNGVLIYDISKKVFLKKETLSIEISREILNIIREFEICPFVYKIVNDELITGYEKLANDYTKAFFEERRQKYYKPFVKLDNLDEFLSKETIYFTLLDEGERLSPIYERLKRIPELRVEFYRDIYSDNLYYVEIFSSKASKYNAVNFLRNHLSFDKITGFGDNLNDLPLFSACDVKIAVGNAKIEVKNSADFIIDTNEENAVAKWLITNFNG